MKNEKLYGSKTTACANWFRLNKKQIEDKKKNKEERKRRYCNNEFIRMSYLHISEKIRWKVIYENNMRAVMASRVIQHGYKRNKENLKDFICTGIFLCSFMLIFNLDFSCFVHF